MATENLTPSSESISSDTFSSENDLSPPIDTGSDVKATPPHRKNTKEEKRRMRNARKKRLRQKRKHAKSIKRLKSKLGAAQVKAHNNESRIITLKRMNVTFWERWRWELEKRKEAMTMVRLGASKWHLKPTTVVHLQVQEIDSSMLADPQINGEQQECYVGRGSFGVVKLQVYRGIHVAVKEFLPRAIKEDVKNEAKILASLCHPFLPCLFGISISTKPFKIVMQYHGFVDSSTSMPPLAHTLSHELLKQEFHLQTKDWLVVSAQLLDAVNYLHTIVGLLHNDIKGDNIVFGKNVSLTTSTTTPRHFQVVLIDFGKATTTTQGKLCRLTELEKETYRLRCSHFAPEVIEGESRQSVYSDMYAVGGLFYRIAERSSVKGSSCEKIVLNIAEKCRLVQCHHRWNAHQALTAIQQILHS